MSIILTDPLFILFIGVCIVVGGIIGLKLHPFLALLLGALVVALITPGSAVEQFALSKGASPAAALQMARNSVGERVALEFGNTAGKIGILIGMAALIGKCLLESGGAERIVRSMLKATGENKAPVAFLVSSFFIGIPVFFDAVIFLMMPLAKAMSMKIGKNYLLLVLSILAGAVMANSLVPPAPGPLYLVGAMQIPMGMMMIAGTLLGLITCTSGYLFATWANKKWNIPVRDSLDAKLEDIKTNLEKEDKQLPGLGFSLLPVIVPLILIITNTFVKSTLTGSTTELSGFQSKLISVIQFLGDKNMALMIAGSLGLVLLANQKYGTKGGVANSVSAALLSGGVIVLITSAGGAFGGMLQQSGISARITELTAGYQMALIPLAFLIAAIIRTAQGSATVALITASGVLAGMAGGQLEYHHLYLGLAIGCGAKLVPWMNDAGFWIVCKISNLTEKEALKTFAPMNIVMGLTGLVIILIAAKLMPLI
jgi:gluconate:H+ symporter, GntP family